MAGRFPRLLALICALGLTGCELSLPDFGKKTRPEETASASENPITGDAIEVAALDAPAGAAKPAAAAAAEADSDEKKPLEPLPEVTTPVVAEPEPAPVVPEVLKTKEQLACEKRKGIWAKSGATHLCVNRTRDSGKQCQSSTQCVGDCLARSGTCSPFQPLIGCNEILDDSGRRMTQCLN